MRNLNLFLRGLNAREKKQKRSEIKLMNLIESLAASFVLHSFVLEILIETRLSLSGGGRRNPSVLVQYLFFS